MRRLADGITNYFFVWTVLAGLAALFFPPAFAWFRGAWIPVSLGVIMLGMGITLSPEDFKRVAARPIEAAAGIGLQYGLMPLLGWGIAYFFALPPAEAVGLILVACCPSGTASNVISFLARADVGLSVTMTAVSTMLAVALTPALSGLLAGGRTEVDMWGLFQTTLTVVILPVCCGVALNRFLPAATRALQPLAPPLAVILIILIVGSVLAGSGGHMRTGGGLRLAAAVLLLHVLGFSVAYAAARLLLGKERAARTISIEVGMQNSGLGVELARRNFADPVTALPGALSALCHCVLGSCLAALWRRWPPSAGAQVIEVQSASGASNRAES